MWTSFKKGKLESLEGFKKKGQVDQKVIGILDSINKNPGLVTSSSCSGRITLLEISEKKGDARFYSKWHREISFEEAWDALSNYRGRRKLWFRCEPFIIHIFAKDLDSAQSVMRLARKSGFKRGGIWGFRNGWPFLELIGTSEFALPVFDGELLISKKHLEYIVKTANATLRKNYSQLERFEKELSSA
jgi:tRNA wybutosine-synthesizing protein 3